MIVAQLTARRDYAVAKILESNGILTKLFTDAYYNPDTIPIFKILDKVLPKKNCKYIQKIPARYSRK